MVFAAYVTVAVAACRLVHKVAHTAFIVRLHGLGIFLVKLLVAHVLEFLQPPALLFRRFFGTLSGSLHNAALLQLMLHILLAHFINVAELLVQLFTYRREYLCKLTETYTIIVNSYFAAYIMKSSRCTVEIALPHIVRIILYILFIKIVFLRKVGNFVVSLAETHASVIIQPFLEPNGLVY